MTSHTTASKRKASTKHFDSNSANEDRVDGKWYALTINDTTQNLSTSLSGALSGSFL
jgi:hypothetical protein